jgi:hypothetical protein
MQQASGRTFLRIFANCPASAVFDFQRQKRRNPLRCQPRRVSALTFTSALRLEYYRLRAAINHRVESSACRGLTFHSWNRANCFRRKRFSADNAARERAARQASPTKSNTTNDSVRRPCATARRLRRVWSRWTDVVVIVKPDTVVGWHRAGFRRYWRWRSRPRGGRPTITDEIRRLIRRLAGEPRLGCTQGPRRAFEARLLSSRNGPSPGIFGVSAAAVTRANAGWRFSGTTAR